MFDVRSVGVVDNHKVYFAADVDFTPVIIDFGTSIFAVSPQKSHDRDAEMLQELCNKVVPELKDLCFIAPDLHKTYPSKDLCDLMQEVLDIIWNVEHVTENTDRYGMISDIVLPCATLVMNHPILNKGVVFKYVKSYISSKGNWTEAMTKSWDLTMEKE